MNYIFLNKSVPGQLNMFPEEQQREDIRTGLKNKYPNVSRVAEDFKGPNHKFATHVSYGYGSYVHSKYKANRKALAGEIKTIMNGGKGWQDGMPRKPFNEQMNNLVKFYNHINSNRKPKEFMEHDSFFDEKLNPIFKKSLFSSFWDENYEKVVKNKSKETKVTQIASVAVLYGYDDKKYLLMGKRADSGKWTLPGGHMEEGETPWQGAKRELFEETGIKASKTDLLFIGDDDVVSELGKNICVYAFLMVAKEKTTTKNDPDAELEGGWKWIDVTNGLPEDVANNLHAKRNVTLHILGLQEDPKVPESFLTITLTHKAMSDTFNEQEVHDILFEKSKEKKVETDQYSIFGDSYKKKNSAPEVSQKKEKKEPSSYWDVLDKEKHPAKVRDERNQHMFDFGDKPKPKTPSEKQQDLLERAKKSDDDFVKRKTGYGVSSNSKTELHKDFDPKKVLPVYQHTSVKDSEGKTHELPKGTHIQHMKSENDLHHYKYQKPGESSAVDLSVHHADHDKFVDSAGLESNDELKKKLFDSSYKKSRKGVEIEVADKISFEKPTEQEEIVPLKSEGFFKSIFNKITFKK